MRVYQNGDQVSSYGNIGSNASEPRGGSDDEADNGDGHRERENRDDENDASDLPSYRENGVSQPFPIQAVCCPDCKCKMNGPTAAMVFGGAGDYYYFEGC